MEMHQIRYFLSMSRVLNFTRAADECNVTQPSLTRAIQKLEDEFGGALFRRERNRTHLTDLGRQMLPHLERTFEAAHAAKQLAMGLGRAEVAPLALGIDAAIESETLDRILAELAVGLPGFELTLSSGSSDDLLESAMNGALDLVVVELPDHAPDRLDAWPLFDHSYHMVTRSDHPLAVGGKPLLLSAREETWIDYEGDGCARLKAVAAAHGFVPIVRHRATDMSQVRRLVACGLGSAFIPRPRDDERLCALRFADAEVKRDVVLAAVAGRKRSIAADAFVRASRACDWAAAAP
jgi:DNA-binding transcriptional LysR family regulator